MASLKGWMALAIQFTLWIQAARGAPSISFPLNSQVPPVARASEPFQFTFSPDSFTSTAGDITYTLSKAPSWLQLDGDARSLFGTPSIADAGPFNVILTASDNSGSTSMESTLIVSTDPSPTLMKPPGEQLTAFGPLSGPNSLLFYPSTPFNFAFDPNTFAWKDHSLHLYAVSSDNTPLPSWIYFDPMALRFSGTTPPLTALVQPPQKFMLKLIGSDIAGFSAASAEFSLTIGIHQLVFDQTIYTVDVTRGEPVNFASLKSNLKLDGTLIRDEDVKDVQTQFPDWMHFNRTSLSFDGIAPGDVTSNNVTLSVTDVYGDVANTIVMLRVQSPLLTGTINDVNATIAESFVYKAPDEILSETDVEATSDAIPPVSWISFNATNLEWSGKVPEDMQPGQIRVNLTVISRVSKVSDSLTFKVNLVEKANVPTSTPPGNEHALPTTAGIAKERKVGPNKTRIVAAVIVPLVVFAVAAMIWFCARGYRISRHQPNRSAKPYNISRPLEPAQEPHLEVEETKPQATEPPPELPLPKRFSGLWKSNPDIQQLQHKQPEMSPSRPRPTRPPRPDDSIAFEQMQQSLFELEGGKPQFTEAASKLSLPKRLSGLWKSNADTQHSQHGTVSPPSIELSAHQVHSMGKNYGESDSPGSSSPRKRREKTHGSLLGARRTSTASSLTNISEMVSRFKSPPRQSTTYSEGQPSVRLVVQSPTNSIISAGRKEKYGYGRRGTSYFAGSATDPLQVSLSSHSWRKTMGSAPPLPPKHSRGQSKPRGLAVRGLSTEGDASHSFTSDLQSESSLAGEGGRVPLHRSGSRLGRTVSRLSRESSVDPYRFRSHTSAPSSRDASASKLSDMMPPENGHHYWYRMDEDAEAEGAGGIDSVCEDEEGADDHVFDNSELQQFEYGVASMAQRPLTPGTPGGIFGWNHPRSATPRIVELRRKGSASNEVETNRRLEMIKSQEASLASIGHTIHSEDGFESRRSDLQKAFL
ncbi:MAG: hypothetical protein M1816_002909 [Peltula sp. TS41687]|nr:MAG: hypothetical protein M1816_002909 [Peltula sp. TS41687]